MKLFNLLLVVGCMSIFGCAVNTGVVPVGKDSFMVSRQASSGFTGRGSLKEESISEAYQYCLNINKTLKITRSTEAEPPYILGNFPKAEVYFKCVDNDLVQNNPNQLNTVSPKDFEKTIPKKVATKEDKLVDGYLDKIPTNWPQMYYYETDDYRYWTICGEALNSQSEAVISSKNKADEIFYTEFPKNKFADLNYETTHMEINTFGNKYKSWRIIRIPRANRD